MRDKMKQRESERVAQKIVPQILFTSTGSIVNPK